MGRKTIRRGPGSRQVSGKDLRLADELHYIQRRAAEHDRRIVTVGGLVFFYGNERCVDPGSRRSSRRPSSARRDPQPLHFEETDTTFAIAGKATTGLRARPSSILTVIPAGCPPSSVIPPAKLRNLGDLKISNMFG